MTNKISNEDEFPNFTNELKTNQQHSASFKTEFYTLAKYMGGNVKKLYEYLGKYDDIEQDEHRAYIWFKANKASFYIGNDEIVGRLAAPLADAYGHDISIDKDINYFNIDGVIPGMQVNQARELWGLLDNKEILPLTHKEDGITFSGKKFIVGAAVDGDSIDEKKVSHFVARIIREEPKGGCFIATACYGDYDAKEVKVLRDYRDNVLSKSYLGKKAVNLYYYFSPGLAKLILKSSTSKNIIRKFLLDPLISVVSNRS